MNVTPQAASTGNLEKKIDELLRNQKEAKLKTIQNKAFRDAKKQYRSYRKKLIGEANSKNREIKKKELARIRKLPTKNRTAARKQLKALLKRRIDAVKSKFPPKISSPGQLREIMSKKVLKI